MKNVLFFTGSGLSKESGIPTFRDAGEGMWENFRIEDVCTHEAMLHNRQQVIQFYNMMRQSLLTKQPNAAHYAIAELQKNADFNVNIVTQNVDDLHERAGGKEIVHLHGELMKLRSSRDELATLSPFDTPNLFEDGWKQRLDDLHPDGSLLRPYIVFFGENVPFMTTAEYLAEDADIIVVVGTSLVVYPAASLLYYAQLNAKIYCVDPGQPDFGQFASRITHIKEAASVGVLEVCRLIESL